MLAYIDSSLLAAAYLPDEQAHWEVAELLTGGVPLVTASLTLAEVAGALARAERGRRVPDLALSLAALHTDVSDTGAVLALQHDQVALEARARELCVVHALRALDALHLAVAELAARPLAAVGEPVAFLTQDRRQRKAADALGFLLEV